MKKVPKNKIKIIVFCLIFIIAEKSWAVQDFSLNRYEVSVLSPQLQVKAETFMAKFLEVSVLQVFFDRYLEGRLDIEKDDYTYFLLKPEGQKYRDEILLEVVKTGFEIVFVEKNLELSKSFLRQFYAMHFDPSQREKKKPFLSPLWKYMSSNSVDMVIVKYTGQANAIDACASLRKVIGNTRGTDIGSVRNVFSGVRLYTFYKVKGEGGIFHRRLFMTKLTYKEDIDPRKIFFPKLTGERAMDDDLGFDSEQKSALELSDYERNMIKQVLGRENINDLSDEDIKILEQRGVVKERRVMLRNNTHRPEKRDAEMVPELALLLNYIDIKNQPGFIAQIGSSI
ncbi:MAG: hypothetical protein HY810_06840 [Candidatus Omnitrophica bacterium]|nr:hypothetical protein [Candidatus Omnitrophota bacterium]